MISGLWFFIGFKDCGERRCTPKNTHGIVGGLPPQRGLRLWGLRHRCNGSKEPRESTPIEVRIIVEGLGV